MTPSSGKTMAVCCAQLYFFLFSKIFYPYNNYWHSQCLPFVFNDDWSGRSSNRSLKKFVFSIIQEEALHGSFRIHTTHDAPWGGEVLPDQSRGVWAAKPLEGKFSATGMETIHFCHESSFYICHCSEHMFVISSIKAPMLSQVLRSTSTVILPDTKGEITCL